jgi:hypothetical protein
MCSGVADLRRPCDSSAQDQGFGMRQSVAPGIDRQESERGLNKLQWGDCPGREAVLGTAGSAEGPGKTAGERDLPTEEAGL